MSLSLLFSFFLFGSCFVWFPLSSASVASVCGVLSPLLSGFSSLCLVPSPLWVLLLAPRVSFVVFVGFPCALVLHGVLLIVLPICR